jgi:hypothetical protein
VSRVSRFTILVASRNSCFERSETGPEKSRAGYTTRPRFPCFMGQLCRRAFDMHFAALNVQLSRAGVRSRGRSRDIRQLFALVGIGARAHADIFQSSPCHCHRRYRSSECRSAARAVLDAHAGVPTHACVADAGRQCRLANTLVSGRASTRGGGGGGTLPEPAGVTVVRGRTTLYQQRADKLLTRPWFFDMPTAVKAKFQLTSFVRKCTCEEHWRLRARPLRLTSR